MIIPLFQVDAFAETLFEGNPAAVCPLPSWLPVKVLQNIAAENNLSETAFVVKEGSVWHLRWFTPVTEVSLCGHATLATAHVLFQHYLRYEDAVTFSSLSGILTARKKEDMIELDFPVDKPVPTSIPFDLVKALGSNPVECFKGTTDYMLVFGSEEEVRKLNPDFDTLKKTSARGIIVTAPGEKSDFVSRFFAPQVGIQEDPVTGSAHTVLTPYWSERLGKVHLTARQVSPRGGSLLCTIADDRVLIRGKALTYLEGNIYLPDNL